MASKKSKKKAVKKKGRTTKRLARPVAKKKARSKSKAGIRAGNSNPDKPNKPLKNEKHEYFCQVYLIHHNGGAAWKTVSGRKDEKTTESDIAAASRLLATVKVKARVQYLIEERAKRVQLDQDKILTMLSDMASADVSEMFDDDGNLLPLKEIPKNVRMLIEGVEVKEIEIGDMKLSEVKKIKVAGRHKTIELAGKHVAVQAFKEKSEISGPDGGPIQSQVTFVGVGTKK